MAGKEAWAIESEPWSRILPGSLGDMGRHFLLLGTSVSSSVNWSESNAAKSLAGEPAVCGGDCTGDGQCAAELGRVNPGPCEG